MIEFDVLFKQFHDENKRMRTKNGHGVTDFLTTTLLLLLQFTNRKRTGKSRKNCFFLKRFSRKIFLFSAGVATQAKREWTQHFKIFWRVSCTRDFFLFPTSSRYVTIHETRFVLFFTFFESFSSILCRIYSNSKQRQITMRL